MPNGFKRRRFSADSILLCVRWYLRVNVSHRHLAEMMLKRGFEVHHTTIYRWIQTCAAIGETGPMVSGLYTPCSWRVDETYIKVCGEWLQLFRAIRGIRELRPNSKTLASFEPRAAPLSPN